MEDPSPSTRLLASLLGGTLIALALTRRTAQMMLLAAAGAALVARAASGRGKKLRAS